MKKPIINMIPLVDIMLVLLLILMCFINQAPLKDHIHSDQPAVFIINVHSKNLYSCKKIGSNCVELLKESDDISKLITTIQVNTDDKSAIIQIALDQSTTDCALFRRIVQELHKAEYRQLKLTLESRNDTLN